MWAAIRLSWPLFIGMIFLMVSNGLLATLLTLRATSLGFSDASIGLMQSAYPAGSLLGCLIVPRLIMRVGHVRIFAALASLASTAALIHLVTHDLWSWGTMLPPSCRALYPSIEKSPARPCAGFKKSKL